MTSFSFGSFYPTSPFSFIFPRKILFLGQKKVFLQMEKHDRKETKILKLSKINELETPAARTHNRLI